MAQLLLQRMLAERGGAQRIRVRSGVIAPYARDGMIPSLDARLALREVGIHLAEDGLASTDLRRHPDVVAEADLIVTITAAQRTMLRALGAADGKPVVTLRELGGEEGDIEDPAGQGEEVFRACRDEIRRALEQAIDRLLLALEP